MKDFSKKYDPKAFEENIYALWEKGGSFAPTSEKTKESFYIPIPPPNVTGVLHLGHALTLTLEDIMTRYHRMKGDATLWVPGTDHAGIATQARVEDKINKEWKTKHDLGRDKFLKECWDWVHKYGGSIKSQIRRMWASCDWSKERFTLDPELNRRVNKAFVDLYSKGLIYKWEYMVNYSPWLQTVLSDAEVDYKEEKGKLYYITYFVSWSDSEIVIATTRPETLLGDVAVAVHPKDKRYKKLLKWNKKLILPILNKEIPLIADEMVDPEFGTGAVKITPAHDPHDFEVALRHKLPLTEIVVGKDGKMTKLAGMFSGQDFMTARQNIVELLKSKWNLSKTENYINRVGYCSRSGTKVETIISKQWFIKVQPLADKVMKGYKKKDFVIIPDRFEKTFEDWMYNLKDWCISRQLWWGHQIPVWYAEDGTQFCAETLPEAQELANKHFKKEVILTQDPDVLDTWFSSALWPFSILDYDMWGGKQNELVKQFYPAQMLETGHDILFFWVIRMLLFWYEFTSQTPFKEIYLHGLVRDKHGKKMSKSLWNGVDPIDMIEKYGTDALRLTLSIWNTPGNDLRFDEEHVTNNMMFINKLWNACRFVHTNLWEDISVIGTDIEKLEAKLMKNYDKLMMHEKWILSRLRYCADLTTVCMDEYDFSRAGEEIHTFTKNEFCDYYIEEFKLTKESSKFWKEVIVYAINMLLKLWHPYIPFVTEELYQNLGFSGKLISSDWPTKLKILRDEKIEKNKVILIDLVREIRRIKAENNIPSNGEIGLFIQAKWVLKTMIEESLDLISWIVKSTKSSIVSEKPEDTENLSYGVLKSGLEIYVDTSGSIDREGERERIKASISDTKEYITMLDQKLLNENFIRKAPPSLVKTEMEKKAQARVKLDKLEEKLKKFL
jgi:valyl-tRNA synthetase